MSQKGLSMPCNSCKVIKTGRKGSKTINVQRAEKIKEGSGIAFTIIMFRDKLVHSKLCTQRKKSINKTPNYIVSTQD